MLIVSEPKVEPIVTLMINQRVVEVECSLCREVIIARPGLRSGEDQEEAIREAVRRHAAVWHSKRG
jgi:hypothetical protein